MGARQFEVAATLTGLCTAAATMNVSAIAMPFELRLGNVSDNMFFKLVGGFEVVTAAVRALFGVNVVLNEDSARRRLGAKDPRMLAMFLPPLVVRRTLPGRALIFGAFAALEKGMNLMLKQRNPPPELSVLSFEFGNP
jgi:hypothetical protein